MLHLIINSKDIVGFSRSEMINITMKYILIIFLLMLSNCAGKYDGTVYSKLVDLTVNSLNVSGVCLAGGINHTLVNTMHDQAIYISVYNSGFKDTDMQQILDDLLGDIERFKNISDVSITSHTYCIDKMNDIHKLSILALKTEGGESK